MCAESHTVHVTKRLQFRPRPSESAHFWNGTRAALVPSHAAHSSAQPKGRRVTPMKLSIATEVTISTGLALVSYSYSSPAVALDTADDVANEALAARLLRLADDVQEAA